MNLTTAVIDVQKNKKSLAEDHGDGSVDGGSKVIVIALGRIISNFLHLTIQ